MLDWTFTPFADRLPPEMLQGQNYVELPTTADERAPRRDLPEGLLAEPQPVILASLVHTRYL
jgi:hypothetical protein